MSLEEKIVRYREIQEKIKLLEEEKKKVYQEILDSFPDCQKEIFSQTCRVRKFVRMTIKTTLEEARIFQATKTEEIVDKDKIKALIKTGMSIPNVDQVAYFLIQDLKTGERVSPN